MTHSVIMIGVVLDNLDVSHGSFVCHHLSYRTQVDSAFYLRGMVK